MQPCHSRRILAHIAGKWWSGVTCVRSPRPSCTAAGGVHTRGGQQLSAAISWRAAWDLEWRSGCLCSPHGGGSHNGCDDDTSEPGEPAGRAGGSGEQLTSVRDATHRRAPRLQLLRLLRSCFERG